MRLTLRTMLAYMDNILDPEDANELRRRIDNSEFAAALMRRIESAVRRIRLESPALDARGMGADANTVAEYLDNTLPPERVPDFERVCLESDMHLAEVAACHQVLAQVLGRRVEIPAEIRRRVYALPEATGSAPVAAERPIEPAAVAGRERHPASPRRVWRTDRPAAKASASPPRRSTRWAVAALLVLMLATAAALIARPWFSRPNRRQEVAGNGPQPPAQQAQTPPAAPGDTSGAAAVDGTLAATADSSVAETSSGPSVEPAGQDEGPAEGAEGDALPQLPDWPDLPVEASPSADTPAESPAEAAGGAGEPADTDQPNRGQPDAETPAASPGPVVAAGGTSDATSVENTGPLPAPAEADAAVAAGAPLDATDAAAPPSVESLLPSSSSVRVEVLTPDEPLLVALADGAWQVAGQSTEFGPSVALLSLPVFRPKVKLNDTVDVTTIDGQWQPAVSSEGQVTSAMDITYGHFLLENPTPTPVHLEIRWGERTARLRISANGGSAALEVRSLRLPGDDPKFLQPHSLATLAVLQGIVRWEESEGKQHDLTAPSGVWALDARPVERLDHPKEPEWVQASAVKPIYRAEGAPMIAELLAGGQPPAEALRSGLEHRRAEVRALAALGLARLGEYDGLLLSLGDPQQHWAWPDIYQGLLEAMARGSEAAEQIEAASRRIYPADGEKIYAFLVGYSPAGLRTGGAELLVGQLASPQLPLRVLAIENLQRITGGKTLGYRAEAAERQRERTIVAWTRRLERGEVAYQPHTLPEAMQWLERAGLLQL